MDMRQALEFSTCTDPGMVRSNNEDSIAADPVIGLAVLAAGMGGYNAGEVASGMATSLIADGLQERWHLRDIERLGRDDAKKLAREAIAEHVARANAAIFNTSRNNPECAGMGTTLTLAYGLGTLVAGVVGYWSIAVLLNMTRSRRLSVFAYYCWAIGVLALLLSTR